MRSCRYLWDAQASFNNILTHMHIECNLLDWKFPDSWKLIHLCVFFHTWYSDLYIWNDLVQFSCSVVSNSLRPHESACQASLWITSSLSLLKLMSIEPVMPSSHLMLCYPLLLLSPIPPSIRVFSNESTLCIRWPKYWSFSFSISPSKEHPGLISFRMDSLDLLAVQGTLQSLLQYHSSKASILWHSAFFTV